MTNREIDALVAEKVMGLTKASEGFDQTNFEPIFNYDGVGYRASDYSTDIIAAFEIIEHLKKQDVYFELYNFSSKWYVKCYKKEDRNKDISSHIKRNHQLVSMAICLAALKIMGVEV